jgi:hypothetical protein
MDKTKLGLKENWKQFVLLVIINAFVGGMVGLERTILPEIVEVDFGIAAKTAILSFIIVLELLKPLLIIIQVLWPISMAGKNC